jgi:putative ABC transport system permease protein
MLVKNPGYTALAALTLALGIGANTVIFSVVNAEMSQPLPYRDPSRLVRMRSMILHGSAEVFSTSYPDFTDWRSQSRSFETMVAYMTHGSATLTGLTGSAHLEALETSWNLFELLGATAEVGSTFRPEEDAPSNHAVILSDHVWRQRFGGSPGILNHTIVLDGTARGHSSASQASNTGRSGRRATG